jgi:cation diffusion facilitator family transporter
MDAREKVAVLSILVNTGLAVFKFVLGTLSGSVAIVADGIHSTSDIVSSIAVLLGLRLSQRKSKNFPYGLYKVENIIAIVSAMAIFFAGFEIVKEVVFQSGHATITYIPAAMIGVCVTIGVTYLFSRYEIRVGKAVGSPSLIADGEHIRTDMLSTVVVLLSLVGQYFDISLDKPAAAIVVLFIVHAGWEILVGGAKVLLDASLDHETLIRIREMLLEEPIVREIKSLTGRNSGSYKFIEAEIVVNAYDLAKAHSASTHLEQSIKAQIQNVDHILIHYEPVQKEALVYAVPLQDRDGTVSEHYGEAPYIAIFSKHLKTHEILRQDMLENPFMTQETGKGIALSEFLVQQGVDVVLIRTPLHGKGPEYVFADANVEIRMTQETQLYDIMNTIE